MNPEPTGKLVPTTSGIDIVLTRLIHGSVQDVWASVTESDRTARWFGRWEGDGRQGGALRVQLGFEEGLPWSDVRVASCDPPHRLALDVLDAAGDWHLEIRLAPRGDHTEMTFVQHRETTAGAGEIGPGWEYYLDNLLASRTGDPMPVFDDYYPSMQTHYETQAAAASSSAHTGS